MTISVQKRGDGLILVAIMLHHRSRDSHWMRDRGALLFSRRKVPFLGHTAVVSSRSRTLGLSRGGLTVIITSRAFVIAAVVFAAIVFGAPVASQALPRSASIQLDAGTNSVEKVGYKKYKKHKKYKYKKYGNGTAISTADGKAIATIAIVDIDTPDIIGTATIPTMSHTITGIIRLIMATIRASTDMAGRGPSSASASASANPGTPRLRPNNRRGFHKLADAPRDADQKVGLRLLRGECPDHAFRGLFCRKLAIEELDCAPAP